MKPNPDSCQAFVKGKDSLVKKPQSNIFAVIRSKIKNMEYADKVDYFFFRPCGILFLVLLVLKVTTIITVSWWIVFTPIIIPILVLWWELSKNAG